MRGNRFCPIRKLLFGAWPFAVGLTEWSPLWRPWPVGVTPSGKFVSERLGSLRSKKKSVCPFAGKTLVKREQDSRYFFFAGRIESFAALANLNLRTLRAGTFTASPVWGL